MWSHPTFQALNPNTSFPNAAIIPVARYESSGTTEIFTRALSSFSDEWNRQYGIFNTKAGWNASVVKTFGQRTSGMADTINNAPFRIGYLTPSSALEVNLPYATIINKRGYAVPASRQAVQKSMEERAKNMTDRLTGVLVDCEGPDTYPIAGYTYFVVRMNESFLDCRTAVELARYITWFTTTNHASVEAENQQMVSVSPTVAAKIQSLVLSQLKCKGKFVMDLVQQQINDELESLKTWKLPVEIISPIVSFIIILLICYALRQRLQYIRMLDRDDWNINFFDIEFHMQKTRRHSTSKVPASLISDSYDNGFACSVAASRGSWHVECM
jgi:PBP superfamily domain